LFSNDSLRSEAIIPLEKEDKEWKIYESISFDDR